MVRSEIWERSTSLPGHRHVRICPGNTSSTKLLTHQITRFASNEGKAAHAAGEVAASLTKEAQEMTVLGVKPQGKSITILASKVAPEACTAHLTKGIRVLLEAKDGNDEDLRQFLIVCSALRFLL